MQIKLPSDCVMWLTLVKTNAGIPRKNTCTYTFLRQGSLQKVWQVSRRCKLQLPIKHSNPHSRSACMCMSMHPVNQRPKHKLIPAVQLSHSERTKFKPMAVVANYCPILASRVRRYIYLAFQTEDHNKFDSHRPGYNKLVGIPS